MLQSFRLTSIRCTVATALSLFAVSTLSASPIHAIGVTTITGEATTLADYKGEVMLIVNVASKCGHTPQYDQLEAAYKKYHAKGFEVLGFPCNQFGKQEPGTNQEIAEFCKSNYGVSFPLFDKIEVNGNGRHPLYTALAGSDSPFAGDIGWNFTKFLIGRDGAILARFKSGTKVDSPEVIRAIEAALD